MTNVYSTQVFKGFFYMRKFDGPSVKRHMVLTNCKGFVAYLTSRAGYLSNEEKKKLVKIKLAVQHRNRSGKVKNKFTGVRKLLKESQLLVCVGHVCYPCNKLGLWNLP